MALERRRPASVVRRVATYGVAADIVVALLAGLVLGSVVGWAVLVVGLIVIAVFYGNARQVLRTRGMTRR